MPRLKTISRETLLNAAMRVIMSRGLADLTLDAVAAEAGISKGGVLYSYKTKDDLLRGLVGYFLERLDADILTKVANDPESTGRWMRAYIASAISDGNLKGLPQADPSEVERLHSALFAAIAANPAYLNDPARHEQSRQWHEAIQNDGVEVIEHYITLLAMDGLHMWQLLGVHMPEEMKNLIVERLKSRTRPGGVTKPDPKPKTSPKKTTSPKTTKRKRSP